MHKSVEGWVQKQVRSFLGWMNDGQSWAWCCWASGLDNLGAVFMKKYHNVANAKVGTKVIFIENKKINYGMLEIPQC